MAFQPSQIHAVSAIASLQESCILWLTNRYRSSMNFSLSNSYKNQHPTSGPTSACLGKGVVELLILRRLFNVDQGRRDSNQPVYNAANAYIPPALLPQETHTVEPAMSAM